MEIIWKKRDYGSNHWVLDLTIKVEKKRYIGAICYNERAGRPFCTFDFNSLGINGKKIDFTRSEEEMKEEALLFLKNKMETRIEEYTSICNEINSVYK